LPATQPSLQIAADPNNLPFSNEQKAGFENKIAQLIAEDLGSTIDYTWWAQRRGFFREAVRHGSSEIVMGVPADFDRLLTTRPYYRSCYCLVYRTDRGMQIRSLDDPALRELKIGIPLVGGSNLSPPGQALLDRKLIDNIVGYSLYADYRDANPSAQILRDVVDRKIDLAIVWGPLAGYWAKHQSPVLTVVPIESLAFDISIGVKRSQAELKKQIDQIISRRRSRIDQILQEYGVPLLPPRTAQKADAYRPDH
jgi:quinoprotein dehydrogenase-associated probable ABC transporter substrate-binding protein